jgi:Asp-tRNA(Asn)/Glu-tRNA(Gln) amidotransferase A subunit family amidase
MSDQPIAFIGHRLGSAAGNLRNDRTTCRRLSHELNAFVRITPDPAASAAGPRLSMAIKDLVDMEGYAPTYGLIDAPHEPAMVNAPLVTKLLAASVDIVATTKMTPLAYEPSGGNSSQGRPRNPWSFDHICGGSSSGSAVAVAAGCVDVALGSDTAGSLRIPAHCCGITAWKPTHGLIDVTGTLPLAPSLDTIGFLARSAATLHRVAAIFIDTQSTKTVRRIRIARDLVTLSAGPIAQACLAIEATVVGFGCDASDADINPVLVEVDPLVLRCLDGEAARSNASLISAGVLAADLAARLKKGLLITDQELHAARVELVRRAPSMLSELFGDADAILLPVMPITTPRVDQCEPAAPNFSGRTLYALSRYTRFVNGLGLPAVAFPIGFDRDGLPIAAQLVGRHGSDAALLAFASEIQTASSWHDRVPTQVRHFWAGQHHSPEAI